MVEREQQVALFNHHLNAIQDDPIRYGDGLPHSEAPSNSSDAVENLQQEVASLRQALATERQRYQQLFDFSIDAVLVTDNQGVVHEVNRAAIALLNLADASKAIGTPLVNFIAAGDRDAFKLQLNYLTHIRELKDWKLWVQPLDQNPVPVAIATATLYDTMGKPQGLRWWLRDLTEHQQSAEARQALDTERELHKLKLQFIQNASHEFYTPLNIILSSAQLLHRCTEKTNPQRKNLYLQKVQSSVNRIGRMLRELSLLGQPDDSETQLHPVLLDLELFCRKIVEEHIHSETTLETKRTVEFKAQGRCYATCLDSKLLQEILDNLLSNALKFSSPDKPVRFDLHCQGNEAVFRIQDEGIGIPAADLSTLLDAFQSASNPKPFPGNGIGLAIVNQAVELHGGTIEVESEVNQGTTFTVTLPCRCAVPNSLTKL